MRKSFLIKVFTLFIAIFASITSVFAAELDHFQVELSPDSVKVGESLDLTIKAVDKNNVVVPSYKGTVLIFSNSNPEAGMPIVLKDSTYTFKDTDQGVIKFENGVKFTKAGKQELNVFDYENEKIFGKAEITITEGSSSSNQEIEIISPENGLTIGETKIKISGTTVKNHKVKLLINGTENIDLNSNDNGIFEREVENLKNGENTIKAQVLDASNSVIGETSETKIKVDSSGINIRSIKLIPEEVFVEAPYSIELTASPGLKDVNIVINDTIINLKEEGNIGLYKGNSFAPKVANTYKVDANMVNDLGKKLNELGVASLKVKELNSALKQAEPQVSTGTAQVQEIKERDPLKITGLKLVELKTKSILTWDPVSLAKSYNVYKKNSSGGKDFIITVNEPKFEINIEGDKVKYEDFYVSANGEDEQGVYEGILSDPTKIKTGPEVLIVLLISLFFAGMYFFIKGRKNA